MSMHAPSGRDPYDEKPWPFAFKASIAVVAGIFVELWGLYLFSEYLDPYSPPLTKSDFIWGGLLVTAGLLVLGITAGVCVRRTPRP